VDTIYSNYKKIRDYIVGTGHNEELWSMFTINRVSMNLPKVFNKNIYEMIDSFMKTTMHLKDFKDLNNAVYNPPFQETKYVTTGGEDPRCVKLTWMQN
jgi:hypothetical protein